MQPGADILLVIATIVAAMSLSSIVANWTVRSWPITAFISLVIALGIFGYVYVQAPEGLTLFDVPNAFINVAARVLN